MNVSIRWRLGGFGKIGAHTALPSEFTARFEFPSDHTVELDIAVRDVDVDGTMENRPICEAIRVERNPDRPPLSGNELRRMPINNWVEFACAQAALRHSGPGVLEPITSDDEQSDAVADIQSSRRRRRITDSLLRDVSTVYLEAGADASAVRDKFHVSQAQAFRYVRMARERGLLPKGDD